MANTSPVAIRMDAELKKALERAAGEDQRSLSSLVNKVMSDWAKANGKMKGRAT